MCPLKYFFIVSTDAAECPLDALQLAACVKTLGLIDLKVGSPPVQPCCALIQGLIDAEAAACLCTVINGSIGGVEVRLPINISLILTNCGWNNTFK
ncbi:hypothetical protein HU200_008610 [Digitaria exilis]|uniref:Bifunctional inhibitor/plant lipid transfer protein/seed storage helical domain-containing protein n=1 Tax=Digitaria exilis TaxID=1010633 RepID=A0A835KNV3_9POAL|nr:hypothetical protein HU200_008610 [Digitaria exilis]